MSSCVQRHRSRRVDALKTLKSIPFWWYLVQSSLIKQSAVWVEFASQRELSVGSWLYAVRVSRPSGNEKIVLHSTPLSAVRTQMHSSAGTGAKNDENNHTSKKPDMCSKQVENCENCLPWDLCSWSTVSHFSEIGSGIWSSAFYLLWNNFLLFQCICVVCVQSRMLSIRRRPCNFCKWRWTNLSPRKFVGLGGLEQNQARHKRRDMSHSLPAVCFFASYGGGIGLIVFTATTLIFSVKGVKQSSEDRGVLVNSGWFWMFQWVSMTGFNSMWWRSWYLSPLLAVLSWAIWQVDCFRWLWLTQNPDLKTAECLSVWGNPHNAKCWRVALCLLMLTCCPTALVLLLHRRPCGMWTYSIHCAMLNNMTYARWTYLDKAWQALSWRIH